MNECICQECAYYREQLHEMAETLGNAKAALISTGQTTINAIEKIQALQEQALNAAPVLLAADNLMTAQEDYDHETVMKMLHELNEAVHLWRSKLPS